MHTEVFKSYYFYCAILVVKMMFMSALTGFKRIKNGVFINPEDAAARKVKVSTSEKVERVRRAHLNDLENIFPFFIIAYIYCETNPDVYFANLLFRIFCIARITHTFVYAVMPLPPYPRGISWAIGFLITGYMASQCLIHFMT